MSDRGYCDRIKDLQLATRHSQEEDRGHGKVKCNSSIKLQTVGGPFGY